MKYSGMQRSNWIRAVIAKEKDWWLEAARFHFPYSCDVLENGFFIIYQE